MNGLIDTVQCGVLVVDDADTVRDLNRTLADALGRSPAEVRGRPVGEFLAAGSRLYYRNHFVPLLRLRGSVREVYLSLVTASGIDLPVLLNATRHKGPGGVQNVVAVSALDPPPGTDSHARWPAGVSTTRGQELPGGCRSHVGAHLQTHDERFTQPPPKGQLGMRIKTLHNASRAPIAVLGDPDGASLKGAPTT